MSGLRVVFFVLAAVLLGGCDLLATRSPEVEGGQNSEWTPPTLPDIVVTNLKRAWEIGNFNDYRRALTSDFTFEADPGDAAQLEIEFPGTGVLDDWNAEVEVEVATAVRGAVDSLKVDFVRFEDDLGQTVRLQKYNYVVSLYVGGAQTDYVGDAWFTIARQENGDWLIRDWMDVADQGPEDSWSLLKGRNRLTEGG
jgi:hypothetical protein